jgi:hypothetical protein
MLGLTVPWLALLASRVAAAVAAGVLAAVGTIAFLISNAYMPGKYNIRVDLCFLPPLMLAVWLECIGLSVWALRAKHHGPGDRRRTRRCT